ncbi:MAG: hypothetical protein ACT4O2_05050, partial [Beijerinckiaceae bacterium]
AKAFFHGRTFSPRHPHLLLASATKKCNPCVRYEMSPMSRAAHQLLLYIQMVLLPKIQIGNRMRSNGGLRAVDHIFTALP